MRKTLSKMLSVAVAGTLAASVTAGGTIAYAAEVPVPCDSITGGGFTFKDDGERVNYGAHGGCKNGAFWGHVNYVDHGGFAGERPYHVNSTDITGYLADPAVPGARDICGVANTNAGETVLFRVRLIEGGATGPDQFGIRLSNGYLVTTRAVGGGSVKLHKPNPSTTPPDPLPDEATACGGLESPDDLPPED
jgi:hypothetical protein